MSDQERNERLAKLEAKFDIFLQLLNEIRNDLKDHPSKEDIDELKERVKELEEARLKMAIKLYSTSAILTLILSYLTQYILK